MPGQSTSIPVSFAAALALLISCNSTTHAGENAAHAIAEKFAGAHEDAGPDASEDAGASESQPSAADRIEALLRKEEDDAETPQRWDATISAVEERTRNVEELIKSTTEDVPQIDVEPAEAQLESGPMPEHQSDPPDNIANDRPDEIADPAQSDLLFSDIEIKSHDAVPAARTNSDLPEPRYALGGRSLVAEGVSAASDLATNVTVLLVMRPGNKGIRRFKKTADPILCKSNVCYMSQGAHRNAIKMPRGKALGPFNTLGLRAGACRQKLRCVFRDIDIGDAGAGIQPVDLKFMRHDRRERRNVKADPTCALVAGRLQCSQSIEAKDWRAWIVPEKTAAAAGASALEDALDAGLRDTPIAAAHSP